ncbi:MAG: hypothetical protein FJ320_01635 [SAR202 cluster bacterium]|nr:hypothetical protein [SAR202 cluster bacterium]
MAQISKAPNQPDTAQTENSQVVTDAVQQLTKLQDHFLERLHYYTHRKAEVRQVQHSDGRILKALDKAIYSTYLDCVEQGVGEDAKAILKVADKAVKS